MVELSSFAIPRQTIEWANVAAREADEIAQTFAKNNAFQWAVEPDSKIGYYALKYKLVKPIPSVLNRKVNEAVNNTRHAFDQILYSAAAAINKPFKDDAHFPWRENPTDLDAVFRGPKVKIPSEFWDVIRRQEPYPTGDSYPGGDDFVREVSKIANRKHTIGLAVGVEPFQTSFSGMVNQVFDEVMYLTGPTWDAEKNEAIIAVTNAQPPEFGNQSVATYIALSGTKSLSATPFQRVLAKFINKAEDTLHAFEAECIKLGFG